jgi:peptide subunit release factor RF-3
MAVERERGISVSSAVTSFEHEGLAFNLLVTPSHQDFTEDTYGPLTPVDSAVMVCWTLAKWHHRGMSEQGCELLPSVALSISSLAPF